MAKEGASNETNMNFHLVSSYEQENKVMYTEAKFNKHCLQAWVAWAQKNKGL